MKQNIISHIVLILDRSTSMTPHEKAVPQVGDKLIAGLAAHRIPDQETRITVYTFSTPQAGAISAATCLIYDMDVLRVPSIAGMYEVAGGTALCDAMLDVIADLKLTPEKYGDHSFLVYLLTDGEELHSTSGGRRALPGVIGALPDNWTLAGFTPNATGKHWLTRWGFPPGNIEIWDPARNDAVEEAGAAMASATGAYLTSRSAGVRSTTSLFTMNAPSVSELKRTLTPLTQGSYFFLTVDEESLRQVERGRIDQFTALKTGKPYSPGMVFYEMTVRVRIQDHKKVAVAIWDKASNAEQVYSGAHARAMLGLPEKGEVRVSPGPWSAKGYKVFIASTSYNRRLIPGTRVLVLR
jgi:hypothetical protein